MRVVSYIRVSTSLQAVDGVSLDAQLGRIEAWCAANGGTLAREDVHVDAGISGKRSDNRPALQAALESVCRDRGALVVYSLSRLARSTRDTITIAERLEAAGADLVSLTERIDTTSASGKMVFRMLAVLAEFERDLVSERTRTAVAHKRAKSERIGQIPYGWALAPDGRTLAECPREQEALAVIRRLAAAEPKLSPRAIAAELGRLGIPTKGGGPRWMHTTVIKILNRRAPAAQDRGTP